MKVILGDHHENFICRRRFNSYTNENDSTNHKEKCGHDILCTLRTSSDSHLYWKKLFDFRIIADVEAANEIDDSSLGDKTTNIYKQNPVLNGYYTISELEDVFESGYYEYLLGYNKVD